MKAIVKSTGEVVTLDIASVIIMDNGTRIYRELNNKNRSFTHEDLALFDMSYWDFIVAWLPNYTHDDRVAYSDDLQCALDNEADEDKLERVRSMFGVTREEWVNAQTNIDAQLFREALENHNRQMYQVDTISE